MFTALLKWPNVLTKLLLLEEGVKKFKKEKESFDEIFDICSCTCFDRDIDRNFCKCDVKIPVLE